MIPMIEPTTATHSRTRKTTGQKPESPKSNGNTCSIRTAAVSPMRGGDDGAGRGQPPRVPDQVEQVQRDGDDQREIDQPQHGLEVGGQERNGVPSRPHVEKPQQYRVDHRPGDVAGPPARHDGRFPIVVVMTLPPSRRR